jgi:hypothetical protein
MCALGFRVGDNPGIEGFRYALRRYGDLSGGTAWLILSDPAAASLERRHGAAVSDLERGLKTKGRCSQDE